MDSAMLKVKSASSAIGGSGSTTIASAASKPTGRPRPVRNMARSGGKAEAVVAVVGSAAGSSAGGVGGAAPARRAARS